MDDILVRIKRAILAGRYAFSEKARIEMEADSLTELDVAESIVNAVAIHTNGSAPEVHYAGNPANTCMSSRVQT
jgi:hypothetical protein